MRRYSSVSLCLLVLVCGVVGVVALSASVGADGLEAVDGEGTEAEPYVVTNATELQSVADEPSAVYVLGDDVDAGETSDWNDGDGFEPIGDESDPFTGSFDGNGYTISNLAIDRSDETYVGLFGYADDGTITDVALEDATIVGGEYVGGLIAWNEGATVSKASTSGDVSSDRSTGRNVIGGLVGVNDGGEVTESETIGAVRGSVDTNSTTVGGVVGANVWDGTVSSSSARGSVTGDSEFVYLGGLVGHNQNATIVDSFAAGDVRGDGTFEANVGGLVGWNQRATVTTSYATGAVTGSSDDVFAGGLVGWNHHASVTDSYATGAVTSSGETITAGGLVGLNDRGTVSDSYAAGPMIESGDEAGAGEDGSGGEEDEDDSRIGGLIGSTNDATVETSYWDREKTGLSTSAGQNASAGVNTSRLTGEAVTDTTALDFEDTWIVTDGYPVLHSEEITVTDVSVSETSLEAGETVTVTVALENTGDAAGERTVALAVDGERVAEERVSVATSESTTVELEHGIDDSGTYTLAAGGTELEVTVGSAAGADDTGAASDGTGTDEDDEDDDDDSQPGFGAVSAILALTLALLAVGITARRRR